MEYEIHKLSVKYKTYTLILLFIATLTLYLLYVQSYAQLSQSNLLSTLEYPNNAVLKYFKFSANSTEEINVNITTDPDYLVYSSKCRIPNVDPFNEEVKHLYKIKPYTKCTKLPLLTYITVNETTAVLHINQTAIHHYSQNGVFCCYSSVTRKEDKKNPDATINVSKCEEFDNNVTFSEDFIIVECNDVLLKKQVYKNVHAAIRINDSVKKKMENQTNQKQLNILCVGIDSVSRLNFMREMPKTRSFLEKNKWIELQGYNKVADNTYPNLMGLLSGMNESFAYEKCKPFKIGYLDKCKLLWYDYRNLGFITGYAEDESNINTFNFHKKGFLHEPTDYYFRPYMIAAEKKLKSSKVDEMTYCTGPETSGERILNLAKDFAETFRKYSYFGFFWMNSFSHNKLNSLSRMDNKVREFLEEISKDDILDNTIVLFFSDHGLRFGEIRYTHTGWLEERLPIFFMLLPEWFKISFPNKYKNLLLNKSKLTTPYDIYMTLQELLIISERNYSIVPSTACAKCKSIFEEIEVNRSCEDASIKQHWCTCGGYEHISTGNSTVKAAGEFILNKIQATIDSYTKDSKKCAKFTIKKIMTASISSNGEDWYKNDTYLLIILQTKPNAVFEGTVSVENKEGRLDFQMQGSISRLDYYDPHSHCVNDSNLKKYCYCNR
ncbi:hypothetical protein ILUMI_22204 [Ignelater luminosus]|uniref:DUF229 domain containing protein n=1 Tax=Ignelater luminosus TaxID=2038154 RepID=A0A8K0CEZ1_IGNLU|nr:hypothetical protein ILUMI_22204 [Ignelater luminosus]